MTRVFNRLETTNKSLLKIAYTIRQMATKKTLIKLSLANPDRVDYVSALFAAVDWCVRSFKQFNTQHTTANVEENIQLIIII